MNRININDIFNISSEKEFESLALKIFKHQFENNPVYRSFCDLLYVHPSDVHVIEDIPFLPIQFFKSHRVLASKDPISNIFKSSGTSGQERSKHMVTDISIYEKSFRKTFAEFYGNIKDYVVMALLPSYVEQGDSSLVFMVNDLIKQSGHVKSGFYLSDQKELSNTLNSLNDAGEKSILIGVSYALLDLVESYSFHLKNTIIMETGGMKGRRKEMIRQELHEALKRGFGVNEIHSEYGMTELLSQAYSEGHGRFSCPPWMKIMIRNTEDALSLEPKGKTGGINVIDLANINSCSFIATQDLGKSYEDDSFEVLGRFDNTDIRGCNLMVF